MNGEDDHPTTTSTTDDRSASSSEENSDELNSRDELHISQEKKLARRKQKKKQNQRRPWVTRFRSRLPRARKKKKIRLTERKGPKSLFWTPIKQFLVFLLYKVPYLNRFLTDKSGLKRVITLDASLSPTEGGVVTSNTTGPRWKGNAISTTKYGPITFIPLNLYEQFKRFANLWFLIVAILQFIPSISPLNPASSIIPLVFVLLVTAVKEAIEDIKRRLTDRKLNTTKARIWKGDKFHTVTWKKVKVGHIVKLKNNESIPADVVILNTSNPDGICYVETANLDGESNLKVRQALDMTVDAISDEQSLANWRATFEFEAPNPELYSFTATIEVEEDNPVPLSLEQTLWRGCTLRNTDWVYAVVVYTGMETKIMKNARLTPHKRSQIEKDMNTAIISVFVFLVFVAFLCGIGAGAWATITGYDLTYLELRRIESSAAVWGILAFASHLILLNNMIPLSLYVYMEGLKLIMAFRIRSDVEMYHPETDTPARTNTSNLAEELGQVEYIFSDKTGTLTSNTMYFRRCNIKGESFGENPEMGGAAPAEAGNDHPEAAPIFTDEALLSTMRETAAADAFFKILAVCHTVIISTQKGKSENSDSDSDDSDSDSDSEKKKKKKKQEGEEEDEDEEKEKEKVEEDGYASDIEEGDAEGKEGEQVYQAASPDEAALVAAARTLGYAFSGRTNQSISITVNGQEETWMLLNILEFNSNRKRMSVIVRDPSDGKLKLLCKGADQVIFERLAGGQDKVRDEVFNALSEFATVGLRTLCLAMKTIEEEDYNAWNEDYQDAALQLEHREEAVDKVANKIEQDLELIGCTAIEDRLQDGVPDAIGTLLKAGIKMWVLTGDKMETAINIGFSCSLLNTKLHRIVFSSEKVDHNRGLAITNQDEAIIQLERYIRHYFPDMKPWHPAKIGLSEKVLSEMQDLSLMKEADEVMRRNEGKKSGEYGLIIDGKSLKQYLPAKENGGFNELSSRFLELAMRCKVVICCRVSPGQKALVVDLVKVGIKARTLAIGDGANDVPMIQAANVGVGISGKEGRQAVNTADYAIAQFRYLVPLLLVHGHWSYRRLSVMVLYSFYKNMAFAISTFIYGFFNGFSAQSLYESWAISLYNVLFTGLPIFAIAVFDKQNSRQQLLRYPQLYERGRLSKDFSWFKYWVWLFKGMWEACVIFFFGLAAVWNSNYASNGRVLDISAFGNLVFTSLIVSVNLHVSMITRTWTIWNHLSVYLSVLIWPVFIILLSIIPPNSVVKADLVYWEAFNFMSTATFWLTPIVTAVLAVLPTFIWRTIQRNYFPANYQIVQEIGRIQRKDEKKKLNRPRKLKNLFLRRSPSGESNEGDEKYTGYAFSQSPGSVDMLMSLGLAPLPKKLRNKMRKKQQKAELETLDVEKEAEKAEEEQDVDESVTPTDTDADSDEVPMDH